MGGGGPPASGPRSYHFQCNCALPRGVGSRPQCERRRGPLPVRPAGQRGAGGRREPVRSLGARAGAGFPAILLLSAPATSCSGPAAPPALETGGPLDAVQPDALPPPLGLAADRLLVDAAASV